MFGGFSPKVKDVTVFGNSWVKDQTLSNRTFPLSGVVSTSPALIWEGRSLSPSTPADSRFRALMIPVQGNPSYPSWKLQHSQANAAYSDALAFEASGYGGIKPLFTASGYTRINTDNASTVDTLLSLDVRSSGSTNHIGMSFGTTTRAAWSVNTGGTVEYRAAGASSIHSFMVGGSIGSQTLIAQIYSSGFYNSYSNFNNGKVTAGSADQSVQTTLSTYGSFAAKGVLVTSSNYTLTENETFVYIDPANAAFCVGNPTACNTYLTEGNCNAHSGVGCNWFAGNSCSAFNGDTGACTGQAGCSLETSPCSTADNTDQSTCEAQDDAFGGGCSWDTATCPAFTTTATCQAQAGCTADVTGDCTALDFAGCTAQSECTVTNAGDCSAFNGDESGCLAAGGASQCAWNAGDSTCSGSYFTACSGNYFVGCNGALCGGSFNTGNCLGSFGAACQGTASCANLTDDGSTLCNAEAGCLWQIGINVTLPTTANASRGSVGRIYSIMHVGSTGTASISGASGQPIFQYTTLSLFKKGDKVLLHNQNITFQCSVFTSSTPCNAQTGCQWLPTCSTIGDQPTCDSTNGCAWDGENNVCTGPAARCFGTYSNGSHWYPHSLERGLAYVAKTANYTITDIDDVVDVTANSVTLTLPNASTTNGKEYTLNNSGAGTVTLNTTGGQTINGAASGTVTIASGGVKVLVSNNANWIIKSAS